MSTQDQKNWNHNLITFLAQVMHFTRLKTFKKHLSSSFYSPRKYQKQCISYFYQKLHFMRNPTKFGSQKLDIYNSTYEFSNFVIFLKKNKFKSILQPLTCGTCWLVGPTGQWHQSRRGALASPISPAARSPTMRVTPTCSPHRAALIGGEHVT